MLREEEKDQASDGGWKTYSRSRSMSWTERPPRKSNSNPLWNSKARACLPPLQPLSITRPSIEEWPRAGSDDIGIWPSSPNPGGRTGSITPRETSTSDPPQIEFDGRIDKLTFSGKECSRITCHIYLGCNAVAKNREILRQNGITHVLNCVGFTCPEYFKNELVYKTLWLQDCPSEDITSIFYDVFDYFEEVSEQGGRVLVHCCQGVSRSTSLVIAYLMWKEGMSFSDAFQHVKAAREVADPNVGFACQLMQCQKRVHALPASPTSMLRMYRMAPHSPYDPLHLVPKMVSDPGPGGLDSRGAFLIQIPSALYIWIGKQCSQVMADNAITAASQVIRYERVQGSVVTVKEKEETFEFWDAFNYKKGIADGCQVMYEEEKKSSPGSRIAPFNTISYLGERNVDAYDLDFQIFHKALAGGVVPAFPLSGAESETCLPARENAWNRLKMKFANGIVKNFVTSYKLNPCPVEMHATQQVMDSRKEHNDTASPVDLCTPSTSRRDSPDSCASYATCNSVWTKDNLKEPVFPISSLSRSPSFSLVESFSSFYVSKPKSNSSSPSVSPSTSDYSSSFTFSPSSSKWSDISSASAQPSPNRLESGDTDRSKIDPTKDGPPHDTASLSPKEPAYPCHASSSLAETTVRSLSRQTTLSTLDEAPQIERS